MVIMSFTKKEKDINMLYRLIMGLYILTGYIYIIIWKKYRHIGNDTL